MAARRDAREWQDPDWEAGPTGTPRALRDVALALLGFLALLVVLLLVARVTGAFTASALSIGGGGLLVYAVATWRSRRVDRGLRPRGGAALRRFVEALEAERRLPEGRRPSGAGTDALHDARDRAERAYAGLAQGVDQPAVSLMVELGEVLGRDWAPDAPLTRQAAEVAAAGRAIEGEHDAMRATLRQRPGIRRARPDLVDPPGR